MKKLAYSILLVMIFSAKVSAQNTEQEFLNLACNFFEQSTKSPKELLTLNVQLYPPVGQNNVQDCEVLLVSPDQNSALVYRQLASSPTHQQILHVNKLSQQKVLYVYGRSQYQRPRFTSPGLGEGGSRGGNPLPASIDTLDFGELEVSYFPGGLGFPGLFQILIKETRSYEKGDSSIGNPKDGSDKYNRTSQRGYAVTDCGGGSVIYNDGSINSHAIKKCHPTRR